jgi:hypothetical protein
VPWRRPGHKGAPFAGPVASALAASCCRASAPLTVMFPAAPSLT